MRIEDTVEEAAYRNRVREWIATEGRDQWPTAAGRESAEERHWVQALQGAGLVGVTWPETYGGQGLSPGHEAIVAAELAEAGMPIPTSMGVGLNMVGPALLVHGSPEQQRQLLPAILSGAAVWCEGFSEPDAGSDLAAIRTRATSQPDGSYRVSGAKVWCSFAHASDWCLLLARTGAREHGSRAITCFLVPMTSPGVSVRPLRQITGESEFNEVFFDEVELPSSAVLDGPGRGWAVAMTTLFYERSRYHDQLAGFAVNLSGLARRVAADPKLRDDARVLERLAGAWTDLQIVRATMLRLGQERDPGGTTTAAGLALKLLWTGAIEGLTSLALDVLGPMAAVESSDETVDGHSWQRELFLAQMWAVAGGSTEIARSVLAEQSLGLPRSR
ncbi:MAG TPA: acyl-CoA dehydrogenase family protein [Mycobacteriales bacterium]|jgi:alkylation response protein AidB-like acyl-CoA dehydrogenase|nr:acyl-CoA dehydrogenase family protein [Mycobacteriales bacterium]